jgi:hypothetical protein
MPSVIHNFNNDSKSWKIHAYNLKSISGDHLNLTASNNKNIYLNVSGGLVNTSYLDVSNNLRVYGNSVFASDLHTDNSSVKIPNTYNNYAFANHNNLLTNLTSQGNTWIDLSGSGYKVDYSPLSNNSKVFLHGKINYIASAESEQFISFQLLRISNNTETILFSDMSFGSVFGVIQNGIYSFDYVDSPSSSDNITYYLKYQISDDGNTIDVSSGVLGYDDSNINCLMAQELYIPSMDGIIQTVNTSLGNVFQDNRDASFNNVDVSGDFIVTGNLTVSNGSSAGASDGDVLSVSGGNLVFSPAPPVSLAKVYGSFRLGSNQTANGYAPGSVINGWTPFANGVGLTLVGTSDIEVLRPGFYHVSVVIGGQNNIDIDAMYTKLTTNNNATLIGAGDQHLGAGDDTRALTQSYSGVFQITNIATQRLRVVGYLNPPSNPLWLAGNLLGTFATLISIHNVD